MKISLLVALYMYGYLTSWIFHFPSCSIFVLLRIWVRSFSVM